MQVFGLRKQDYPIDPEAVTHIEVKPGCCVIYLKGGAVVETASAIDELLEGIDRHRRAPLILKKMPLPQK